MNNLPLVSIAVITYNQETTISQTLDCILNQKIQFPVEIIIGEDCSTDKTREICIRYKNTYPEIIRLILHEQNQGLLKNYQSVVNACRGKYIAQCAGDDYWHNPDKLKLQVEFLETHSDYGLVHSDVDVLLVKYNKIKKPKRNNIPAGYVYQSLMEKGNHIFAASVLFRRNLLDYADFDAYIKHGFMMEDYPMWLEFSNHTKFFYMNTSTITYRMNIRSISIFDDYTKSIAFEENTQKAQKYFYSKYPDNIDTGRMETLYHICFLKLALKFNVHKDIVFHSKYLPDKTIKQKIIKHLLKYKMFRFVIIWLYTDI
jgi:glycosyltransferase involved in cell wall biosynthesis